MVILCFSQVLSVNAASEEPEDTTTVRVAFPVQDGMSYSREDAKTIPIIALTANAFAEDVVKAEQAGMNAHIAKPIDVAKLKKCLATLLRNY